MGCSASCPCLKRKDCCEEAAELYLRCLSLDPSDADAAHSAWAGVYLSPKSDDSCRISPWQENPDTLR